MGIETEKLKLSGNSILFLLKHNCFLPILQQKYEGPVFVSSRKRACLPTFYEGKKCDPGKLSQSK